MALIDEQSCICVKSELDLFDVPPTQTSIDQGGMVDYHPIAAPSDVGPIEFYIPGSGDDYLDPANMYLHFSCKIRGVDGGVLADDAPFAPVNLLMHSLFSHVDISLNDKLISSASGNYRAYLETLLNYGKTTKDSQLTAGLWYKDDAGAMDATDNANSGLVKRKRLSERSKTIDLVGRLHSDLFFQEKLLLNGIGLRLKLVRNKDSFVLLSGARDAAFKVSIIKAVLRARKVRVSPAVSLAHAKALEISNAKYLMDRVECKTFSEPANSLPMNQEHIFQGQLPVRVVVGCVDHDAFNGLYSKNLFNFKNYKITKLALQVDAQDQPVKPILCNFDDGVNAEAYVNMFTGTRKAFKDEDIDVSREDYVGGYTLFYFDLTPDLGELDHYSLLKRGTVRLEITFAEALAQTINVIVYAEFQNVLEIDRNRNVFFDFAA